MNKKLPYQWAIAVAFLFLILQIVFVTLGMTLDSNVTFFDYFAFTLGGLIVGAALVYLLRRSPTKSATRSTLIGFIVGIPFALLGLFLGGPSGAFGTLLFSISPSIFVMMIGFIVGMIRGRKK